MKKWLLIIALLGLVLTLNAQISVDDLVHNPDKYIYGVGSASTLEEAESIALQNLNVSISATIKTIYKEDVIETNKKKAGQDECSIEEYTLRIVETSANNFLKNTQKIISIYEPENSKFEVYRYITKASKNAIFEGRKQRAIEYYTQVTDDMEQLNINRVLLDYYSALLLINSHPDRDTIRILQGSVEKNFKMLMENKLRNTLDSIKFESISENKMSNSYRINVKATYNGENICSLYYRYFDGNEIIKGNIIDGYGVIDIQKAKYEQCESFPVNIYFGKGKLERTQLIDPELQALEEFLYIQKFENVKLIRKPGDEMQQLEVQTQDIKGCVDESPVSDEERYVIEQVMQQVVNAIRLGECSEIEECFTATGLSQFQKLMNYGELHIYEDNRKIRLVKVGNRIQVRSIPVILKLREPAETRIFSEKLCFIFEDNRVSWVNFALEDHYIEDIISKNIHTKDFEKRLAGLNFMEYYRTIFNLKQADLISQIFADSAQIFVGYVKESEEISEDLVRELNQNLESKKVVIEKWPKDQYINRLRDNVFPDNKYIHIDFKDMLLLKRSKDKPIYAIALHQDYYSSTYSDQGYLMLLINFEDAEEPRIFFRYWQPEQIGEDELRGITPGDIHL